MEIPTFHEFWCGDLLFIQVNTCSARASPCKVVDVVRRGGGRTTRFHRRLRCSLTPALQLLPWSVRLLCIVVVTWTPSMSICWMERHWSPEPLRMSVQQEDTKCFLCHLPLASRMRCVRGAQLDSFAGYFVNRTLTGLARRIVDVSRYLHYTSSLRSPSSIR